MPLRLLAAIAWTLVASLAMVASAHGASVREDFEGPEPSWAAVNSDVRFRVDQHARVAHQSITEQGGAACEYIELTAEPAGTFVHVGHRVEPLPVIDELEVSVVVSANRPGIQLLARIVLPRAIDPETGQPRTTLISGTSYNSVGTWERLKLADCNKLVERQAWVLRTQFQTAIDTREAFIDLVMLNAYGGGGRTQLWIDCLQATGVVASPALAAAGPRPPVPTATQPDAVAPAVARGVEVRGPMVAAAGRPLFPRVVEYRGESLEWLRRIGFNAIWVQTPPSRELLDEAARTRMWLVCAPPLDAQQLGPWYDVVLAWDLGSGLTAADLERTRVAAETIRRLDATAPRPLLLHAETGIRSVSRHADFLRLERAPLGTSWELSKLGPWIRTRLQLARPGTPAWFTVQTQPHPVLADQAALVTREAIRPEVEPEQVRMMVYAALAAGVRGLVFRSSTPLDGQDPASRSRAALMELVNLELDMLETWGTSGTFRDELTTITPEIRAAVLQTDRAQLVLPMWLGERAQIVPGQSAAQGATVVVPGVPESSDAYEITAGGLRPLRLQRVTGGVRVTLDEFTNVAMVVLSQDPSVVSHLTRRLARDGRRMAELERDLAAHQYQRAAFIDQQLTALGSRLAEGPRWLQMAAQNLQQAEAALAAGNLQAAFLESRRSQRPLSLVERNHWQQVTQSLTSPAESPLALVWDTLPAHVRMAERLRSVSTWTNQLPEGEVENLQRMLDVGWRHMQHPIDGLRADAELSPAVRLLPPSNSSTGAHSGLNTLPGRYCLRLSCLPVSPDGFTGQAESPPVWVASPPVPVEAGSWVRIRGWVHIPKPITGSDDGLLVVDSLGGEPLAVRLLSTEGWQPFVVYRVAPKSGPVNITVALCGVGEALIDDLAIEVAPGR